MLLNSGDSASVLEFEKKISQLFCTMKHGYGHDTDTNTPTQLII